MIRYHNDLQIWYSHSFLAIERFEETIKFHSSEIKNKFEYFSDMTRSEIKEHFKKLKEELEISYVFKIISSTEAIFKKDFKRRAMQKKSGIEPDKSFHEVFIKKGRELSNILFKLFLWSYKSANIDPPLALIPDKGIHK